MSKFFTALLAGLLISSFVQGASTPSNRQTSEAGRSGVVQTGSLDSERMEKNLQNLSWEQFRTIVNSIPRLKADVDAYGPLGWQYVQANYKTYRWRKNIDKLHEDQKKRLADLIGEVQEGAGQSN